MAAPSALEDFAPHVGKTFHFAPSGHALVLSRIDAGRPPPAGMRQPFVLVFSGPPGPGHMPEGLKEARIEDGEPFDLYVSPIQTLSADRQDYQASFN
jgi:hypothetical protein